MLKEQRWKVVHCERSCMEDILQGLANKNWTIHSIHGVGISRLVSIIATKWVRVKG